MDPWAKAAECDHAIGRVADPEARKVLEDLRSFWVQVGNELPAVYMREGAQLPSTAPRFDTQLSAMAQIHTELMATFRSAMH